jgi:hypothetical protein
MLLALGGRLGISNNEIYILYRRLKSIARAELRKRKNRS